MTNLIEASLCVKNGALLLDRHSRGWANKIDLSTLDIKAEQCCVLGQVYGRFITGVKELCLKPDELSDYGFSFVNAGLSVTNELASHRFELLSFIGRFTDRVDHQNVFLVQAWTEEVKARVG